MNTQVRDNLRFLFQAPQARAVHGQDQEVSHDLVVIQRSIDFSITLADTDNIHGGTPLVNENPTSLFTYQTTGHYLLYTNIICEALAATEGRILRFNQRGSTNGNIAASSGAQDAGPPRTIIPMAGALDAAAVGDVACVQIEPFGEGSGKIIADWNASPLFYTHWIGGR